MISPRWRKVLRDLWGNKTRTILVVLSIAVGVFAIGMIMGTNIMLNTDLPAAYETINPPDAFLFVEPFDEELVEVVRNIEGVADVEARREIGASILVDVDEEGNEEWLDISLNFLNDYEDIAVNKIFPVSGAWPPGKESILLERASIDYLQQYDGYEIGDTILLKTRDGVEREVTISGVTHDLNTEPVQFSGRPYAYAEMSMLPWLDIEQEFDELHIVVAPEVEGQPLTKERIQTVANDVRNKVERSGRAVGWLWMPPPGEHPAQQAINPLLYILGVLGGFSLFLSGFLVINIINGLLAQHVKQIGIMKAIGARSGQIASMYMITILIFGLMSLLIAVPLGGLAAYGFASYLAGLVNFDLGGFTIPSQVFLTQAAIGMLVPLVAGFVPVVNGSLLSVREAISDEGLTNGRPARTFFGRIFKFITHKMDRMMHWFTVTILRLSRPMAISLRNTIRRKLRLFFTLFTLTLGGAIFISILSVYASLMATMEDALDYFNYDVEVNFQKAYRIDTIEHFADKIPGVEAAESWVFTSARRLAVDGSEGENLAILGTIADTQVINPVVTEGRWLLPDDTNAVVLNTAVLQQEAREIEVNGETVTDEIKVGDTIVLRMDGQDIEWEVVGLVRSVMTGPIIYANQAHLAREINFVGKSYSVQLIMDRHDAAGQAQYARLIEDYFNDVGLEVSGTGTTGEIREQITFQFNIIVTLMAVMAILIAGVGGLGLMGTMSINVLERTREIGVMRAVGASDRSVRRIVVVEGIFIGLISWVISALISYPLGQMLSDAVGMSLIQTPLTYVFALNGAIGWVIAVIVIATVASLLPARGASKLSVRETLAYE